MPLVRQSIRPVLGLALAVGLVGCGSNIHVRTQAAPNTSFAGRHTFRVLATPRRSDGVALASNDPMLENSITNRALRDEITRDLEARGYQLADGGPADFNVAFYASANQALDLQTYNYGYTWRGWPREYTRVTPYERGTVIVDAVDPRTHELMWRGSGVAPVSDNPNRFVTDAEKEIDAIIRKFPSPT